MMIFKRILILFLNNQDSILFKNVIECSSEGGLPCWACNAVDGGSVVLLEFMSVGQSNFIYISEKVWQKTDRRRMRL